MKRPKFSEATILSVAKTTLTNARSTATALVEFGVTDETLNAFETDIQQAEALPGETRERITLRDLTNDKDEALEGCTSGAASCGRGCNWRLAATQHRCNPSHQRNSGVPWKAKMP